MTTRASTDARAADAPLVTSPPSGGLWLVGTTVVALLALYLLGIDQGATSVFGTDTRIHELLHDARHLIGFPCH